MLFSLLLPMFLGAQTPALPDDVFRVGPGVTSPHVVRKVDPEYSSMAQTDRVQGTVLLQLVVSDKGKATNVTIISPLGFGLDESAQAAVEKWEFTPGRKDGKPVNVLVTVEVNFRSPDRGLNEKLEHQRTSFNADLQTLNRAAAVPIETDLAVKSMLELSRQNYPPAMYVAGKWEIKGDHVAMDLADGLALVQKAAAKNYGPALYEIGIRYMEGRDLAVDIERGLAMLHQATIFGSPQAQWYLGNWYEKGSGVPREPARARRYFRLCAAQGVPLCQFRLGRILFEAPDRRESDYMQAIALFQLAAEKGFDVAQEIVSKETPTLTPGQIAWVNTLKGQLVRK